MITTAWPRWQDEARNHEAACRHAAAAEAARVKSSFEAKALEQATSWEPQVDSVRQCAEEFRATCRSELEVAVRQARQEAEQWRSQCLSEAATCGAGHPGSAVRSAAG
jgi:hypothetical protein